MNRSDENASDEYVQTQAILISSLPLKREF